MKDIFLTVHGGLGDHVCCNAIYRHCADRFDIVELPVKIHNLPSVRFMLKDRPNIATIPVRDDAEMIALATALWRKNNVLRLGMFGEGFNEKHWSESMYRQAGVPFEDRWNKFDVDRDLAREFKPPAEPYAFIHQDIKRGFCLDYCRLPKRLHLVEPEVGKTENLFDYCRLIEEATELHLIDSCFAILADSLTTLKAKRKVVHLYARKGALPPTYKQDWEILK